MSTNLKGCNIIEKDHHSEVLWAWSYPTVSEEQRELVLRKYNDVDCQSQINVFFRLRNDWCYMCIVQVLEADCLQNVKQCALAIWSSEYNPSKYNALCRILCKRYCKTGDTVAVLQHYLAVKVQGSCALEENGTSMCSNFNNIPVNANSQIADLIKAFRLETIIIYTALLLDKRIFVYDHNISSLLQMIEILPLFITHRDMKQSIFPWVHLVPDEFNNVRAHRGFLAGCTDSSLSARPEEFDVLINVAAREVTVSPQAKDTFTMTKTHKDIALFLIQLSESPDVDIVSEIARKTQDLIKQLRSLATTITPEGTEMISVENLRERNFPAPLENFLFNLAIAENIMML